nr:hypothetical protein [Bacteroidota bacterium]
MITNCRHPILLLLTGTLISLTACNKDNDSSPDDGRTHMIIDTDMGIDDAMAILY